MTWLRLLSPRRLLRELKFWQRKVSDLSRECVKRDLELAKIEVMGSRFRMSTTQLLGGMEWKA